ncbi:MAG: type II secretion system minor pseudopilin GspJ [Colwellia sp.]
MRSFIQTIKFKEQGFTLLEVLIAIAIFSVISLTSFTLLDTVLRGEESSKLRTEKNNELQTAFIVIERDLTQIARRTVRLNGEAPTAQFLQTDNDNYASDGEGLGFVKHGWSNPGLLLPRSDLQAVAYRLSDEKLERLHFNFVDAVNGEEAKSRILMSEVNSLAFEYYYGKKWQKELISSKLPRAIAMEIDVEGFGLIRRQFLVAGDSSAGDKAE